jgi:hypothetical protein
MRFSLKVTPGTILWGEDAHRAGGRIATTKRLTPKPRGADPNPVERMGRSSSIAPIASSRD